jgi:hypothetical protein
MRFEERHKLLDPGYLNPETGYELFPEGGMHVAVLTRMPRCKGKMIDWWFGWCGDTEKYKLWHPKDHLVGEWDEFWQPGKYIGASHLAEEKIGGQLVKLKITFKEPSDFFDTSKFPDANVGVAICAETRIQGDDQLRSYLVHFVRDTAFGCEMRSNFWRMVGDEKAALANLTHCYEEMGNLADILPDLYMKEAGAKELKRD